MQPSTVNRALRELYMQQLYSTKTSRWWQDPSLDYSGPLLIQAFPEYCSADTRFAFIGQQTKGWSSSKRGRDPIGKQIGAYEDFVRDSVFQGRYRSPFWTAALNLAEAVTGDRLGLVWSNLYRWDEDEVTPSLPRAWRVSRGLLGEELRIVDPHVLIFAVGTSLTWKLRDFLDLETPYRYAPVQRPGWVLGHIHEGRRLRGLHMVHPGARRRGPKRRFVDHALAHLRLSDSPAMKVP